MDKETKLTLDDAKYLQLMLSMRITGMFKLTIGGLLVGCLLANDRFWFLGYMLSLCIQVSVLISLCERSAPIPLGLNIIIRSLTRSIAISILFIVLCLIPSWKNEVYRIAFIITSSLWLHRVPLNFILKRPFVKEIMHNMHKV